MQYLKYGFAIVVSLSLTSCNQNSSEIGSDFFNGGSLDYSTIDTATVRLSTILFEKLQTNNATRLLVGNHSDGRLGKIVATTFFQLGTPSSLQFPEENINYAYCAVTLKYDGYAYYDTAQTVTLRAHRVEEDIELEDEGALYNTSQFLYSADALGEVTFKPRPHKDDSLEIRLADAFGKELYAKALASDDVMQKSDEFLEYLKGIAIVSDNSDDGCILGFKSSPEIRIYYEDNNEVPAVLKYISLARSSSGVYFNNISCDRSETNLILSSSSDRQLASTTDGESYIQSGAGLALRIDFPHLRDFAQHSNLFITQAILELYPVRKASNVHTPLPSQLIPYGVDGHNLILGQYETDAYLYEDVDLNRTTHYKLNVTDFVKSQITREALNEDAVVFLTPEFSHGIDRIYMASPGYETQTRLRIFYITVNN
jgi:hypothetical protein